MKRFSTLLLTSFLLAGIATGCKNKAPEETPAAQVQQQQQQEPQPAAEEEANNANDAGNADDTQDEESDQEDGDDGVDEAVFIKAAYEVSCVKSKISNPEEQKEILAVVYPRYGFETVEEFAAAETSFKESDSVKSALAEKMKGCTEEVAKGFKTAGADDTPVKNEKEADTADAAQKEEAPAKKAAPKLPYEDASFDIAIKNPNVAGGMLKCSTYKGVIRCQSIGKIEGKSFSLSASGKVAANGVFTINGSHGNDNVTISGKLKGKTGSGKITLHLFERDYNGTW